jgi:hypothetical protein
MLICKTLSRSTLFYSNESWTVRTPDKKRLISTEMHFIRALGWILSDRRRNYDRITYFTDNKSL